ncbi:hypothetical protein M569_06412 [Genlisea aurea]|uniref:Uncharacterized protein n=1 Tax=Genlisea aurea TaxID=192259 RepID=S8DYM3_9LAMI|nr:hypothetical protein M569_06412 [Genlisea aurea]
MESKNQKKAATTATNINLKSTLIVNWIGSAPDPSLLRFVRIEIRRRRRRRCHRTDEISSLRRKNVTRRRRSGGGGEDGDRENHDDPEPAAAHNASSSSASLGSQWKLTTKEKKKIH